MLHFKAWSVFGSRQIPRLLRHTVGKPGEPFSMQSALVLPTRISCLGYEGSPSDSSTQIAHRLLKTKKP